jgi:plasmid maintenance system killer protein
MRRFADEKLREIYETRFAAGVSQRISRPAHEVARLLVAAFSLQDVGVIGPIFRWSNAPERYGLHVHGKWHVTFAWSDGLGAYEIRLERR